MQARIDGARAQEASLTTAAATTGEAAAPAAAGSRSPAAVEAAVGTAPGLAGASPDVRAALVADLERGACVTDALTAAVGSINRLTAAALTRGLGGC